MVEDRVLDEIKLKTKNLLKHCPCRKLRLVEVSELVSDPSVGFAIKISVTGPDWSYDSISLFKKKDLKDPALTKRCVEKVKKAIPEKFFTLTVTHVKTAAESLLYNFTNRLIPDSFAIEKVPYRQMQISSGDAKSFLKLNIKSYQRVLALLDQLKEWPAEITFEKLVDCLKRKELVTLLLYLSKGNI